MIKEIFTQHIGQHQMNNMKEIINLQHFILLVQVIVVMNHMNMVHGDFLLFSS